MVIGIAVNGRPNIQHAMSLDRQCLVGSVLMLVTRFNLMFRLTMIVV